MYEGLSCAATSFDIMIIKSGSHYTCKCRLAKTDNIRVPTHKEFQEINSFQSESCIWLCSIE